jgi:nicotinamide-nucleotide amidase
VNNNALENQDALIYSAAQALGAYLQLHSGSVVTAESCTGGLIGAALTSVPGSSGWFDRGWLTYSNNAKIEQLGVCEQVLEQFGAVSEPVVRQMVTGALSQASDAQLAIAVTGIAGPGGGSESKPVGLVWFGFARRHEDTVVVSAMQHVFAGDRSGVRNQTVLTALQFALKWLEQSDTVK